MKVLMINGSPHKEGNTYIALHEMEKIFAEAQIETEILHIGNKDIRGCVACGVCHKKGACTFDDLVNENMRKMEAKRAKEGLPPQKITNQAHQSVKNINKIDKGMSGTDENSRAKKVEDAYEKASHAKAGSITAKANMVRDFDARNKKK